MKRKLVSLSVVFFSIFILASSAFATNDIFNIYTTDGNGNYNHVDTFAWNALPWLYIHVPQTGWSVTGSFWKSPGSTYFFNGTSGTDLNRWISGNDIENQAEQSVAWLDVQEVGEWNINATYLNAPQGTNGFASTTFTVTPEPIGSILFAVGGIALGIFRKKKSKV